MEYTLVLIEMISAAMKVKNVQSRADLLQKKQIWHVFNVSQYLHSDRDLTDCLREYTPRRAFCANVFSGAPRNHTVDSVKQLD